MKRVSVILLVVLLVLGSSIAAARPGRCVVVLNAADRDAAVATLDGLLEAALRIDGYTITLDTLLEAQRVRAALEAAPSYGCGEPEAE